MKNTERKLFQSLTTTITRTVLMFILLASVFSAGAAFYFLFQAQQKLILSQQDLVAQHAATEVANFLKDRFLVLRQSSDTYDTSTEKRTLVASKLLGNDAAFRQLFIIDNKGQEATRVARLANPPRDNFEKFKQLLLAETMDGEEYVSPVFVDPLTGEPLMLIAVPIRDIFREPQGAFIAELNLKFIWELVAKIKVGESGLVYVVDKDGYFVALKDTSRVLKHENVAWLDGVADFVGLAPSARDGRTRSTTKILRGVEGSDVLSAYVPLISPQWAVVVELPALEVYAPLLDALGYSLLAIVLSMALVYLIGSFIARQITNGIANLNRAAEELSQGKFDVEIATGTTKKENEVDQLASSFKTMAANLRDAHADMEQKVKEKTKELSNKVGELGSANAAVLNLLDDIEKEKKKVDALVVSRTQELTEEKARLLASINSIPFGFLVANNEGRVLLMNGVLMELFKLDEKNGITTIKDISKHLDKDFDLEKRVQQCLIGKKVCELQEILFESRFLRGIIAPIIAWGASSETIGYTLLFEDITEAKVLEKSRDEFFAVASHELRTPLTAIRGNAAMLQDVYKEKFVDKDMAEMVDDIYTASVRLIAIVSDFLDVSRLEQGRVVIENTKFPVAEPIERATRDLMKSAEEKGVFFTFKQPDGLPMVFGDKGRLVQVMMNLLGNALKFSHTGVVAIEAFKEGGFVKVLVSDTGIGIAPKDQALLFHKFQQVGESAITRDVTQSTGLGLYISKLIIEKAGGTMGLLKSAVGEGSTFYFTIPIAP